MSTSGVGALLTGSRQGWGWQCVGLNVIVYCFDFDVRCFGYALVHVLFAFVIRVAGSVVMKGVLLRVTRWWMNRVGRIF